MASLLAENAAPAGPSLPSWREKVSTGRALDRRVSSSAARDKILIRNLSVNARIALDAWGREKSQPVLVSVALSLFQHFHSAAERDEVNQSTINYGTLSKAIIGWVDEEAQEALSLEGFAHLVMEAIYGQSPSPQLLDMIEVELFLPKASLLGAGVGFRYRRASPELEKLDADISKVFFLKDLKIPTIVGVNSHERKSKQFVVVNISIDPLETQTGLDFHIVLQEIVTEIVEGSSFLTLESLATKVATVLIERWVSACSPGSNVTVRTEKPSAIPGAEAAGVEVTRSSRTLPSPQQFRGKTPTY